MKNPMKRQPSVYENERGRLLFHVKTLDPATDEYHNVMNRIDQLDKILNRTSELKKTVIPALGTVGGVAGIYVLQQFGGVLIPKALEAIASRSPQKHQRDD